MRGRCVPRSLPPKDFTFGKSALTGFEPVPARPKRGVLPLHHNAILSHLM